MAERQQRRLQTFARNAYDYPPDFINGMRFRIQNPDNEKSKHMITNIVFGSSLGYIAGFVVESCMLFGIGIIGSAVWGNEIAQMANTPILHNLLFISKTMPYYGALIGFMWNPAKIGRSERHKTEQEEQTRKTRRLIQ